MVNGVVEIRFHGSLTLVTALDKDSVANVSLMVALDRGQLVERVGKVTPRKLALVLAGIDLVLGR